MGIRDYSIREFYKKQRLAGVRSAEIIEMVKDSYPELQEDTIRKICYRLVNQRDK